MVFVGRVLVEKKIKKKNKKKTKESEGEAAANQITTTAEKQNLSTEKKGKKQTETKPSQVRTFPNGLIIEEVFMGKPDGKKAAPGKKVTHHLRIYDSIDIVHLKNNI